MNITEAISRKNWLAYLQVDGDADPALEAQLDEAENIC